jgi:hypothetical protein
MNIIASELYFLGDNILAEVEMALQTFSDVPEVHFIAFTEVMAAKGKDE